MMLVKKNLKKIAINPITLLICIGVGVHVGTSYPSLQDYLKPLSEIFMSLLHMCVLPIIFFSITLSLSELISASKQQSILLPFAVCFVAFTLLTSSMGVGLSHLMGSGDNFQHVNSSTISEIIVNASTVVRSSSESIEGVKDFSFLNFFTQAFPRNVIEAFAKDLALQVLMFSIIFGVALGHSSQTTRAHYAPFAHAALEAFRKIISACLYLLPLGILAQVGTGAATVGLEMLSYMTNFVVAASGAFVLLFVIVTLGMSWRFGTSPLRVVQSFKTPILMALGTRNIIACLPFAQESLSRDLGCESKITELTLPISALVGRFGNVFYFAFTTIFITQVYNVALEWNQLIFVIFSAIFAGIATSGATGIATLALLSISLEPLGLPIGALMVLFIAIDPLIDPLRTLATVYTACGLVPFTHHPKNFKRETKANVAPEVSLT